MSAVLVDDYLGWRCLFFSGRCNVEAVFSSFHRLLADIYYHLLDVGLAFKQLSFYLEGGIEALKTVNFGQHPAATLKQAAAKIKELTEIKRRQNRIRLCLKSIGLKRYKVEAIPAKVD